MPSVRSLLALVCTLLASPAGAMDRAAIDVKGWAAGTHGGNGGVLVRVTTLASSGPGSFAEAVGRSGARVIVFEVGGVIDLAGATIRIDQPYLTIAGQTAPDPGITFIRGGLSVATHDVIVQHIAVRPGENGQPKRSGADTDGLSATGAADLIVDHCSFSWATDENLSASGHRFNGAAPEDWQNGTSHRITFSHNIIAEGLRNATHKKGEHSKGSLIHDNAAQILLYGNLFSSNVERSPLVKGGAQVAVINNLIHNPGTRAIHYNLISHEWGARTPRTGRVTMIGNVLRAGADTLPGTPLFSLGGAGDVAIYMRDNIAVDRNGKPLPQTGSYTASGARMRRAALPYLPPGLRPVPAALLENAIYASVGMRPWSRDAVDFKILSDVAEGRGHIVDSEAESSGYPQYAPTRRPFVEQEWNLADMSPRSAHVN